VKLVSQAKFSGIITLHKVNMTSNRTCDQPNAETAVVSHTSQLIGFGETDSQGLYTSFSLVNVSLVEQETLFPE
jgi:hypothetical protein